MTFDQKVANRWVARFIPVILIGIAGYATWVIVVLICVDYLIKPRPFLHERRPGAAIAILVIYFILLVLVACTYFRLLYTVASNPGYVKRGPGYYAKKTAEAGSGYSSGSRWRLTIDSPGEKNNGAWGSNAGEDRYPAGYAYPPGRLAIGRPTADRESSGLEQFYSKDVFVCEGDGRPIWCSKCMNWKPDRTHHCREVDRCVRKMDHFCPWVGGIVGESNFKFFIQFVSWAAVFCTFILTFMAIFVAERKKETGQVSVHWILTLAFAALFDLFSLGMTGSSVQFTLLNTTTIENLSRTAKVYTLAVYIPRPPDPNSIPPFQTVTYPLTQPTSNSNHSTSQRTFAILRTKPGENPWDLGPFGNFKTVMGSHWYDWLLPIKYSPICNHNSGESDFPLGPVVDRLRQEAGIALPRGDRGQESSKRKHRHSRQDSANEGRRSRSSRSKRRGDRERPHDEEKANGVRLDSSADSGAVS